VRAGTPADYAAIGRVLKQSPEAAQWTPDACNFSVAESGGEFAGFVVWRHTAPDEIEILNLAVDPLHRRAGVAKALLSALPKGSVFLEVRKSNFAARAFYRQAGFEEVGARPRYYRHPDEDAIVMRLQSC
jgi:[ribosomal protein S18]-alanine N-acetyltransferase